MSDEPKTTACPHCGRTDVPVCAHCGKRVPHGFTPGTALPCPCRGLNPSEVTRDVLRNAKLEAEEVKARRLRHATN